ncbi:MAG: transposase [Desulfuromonadaceae bacterium]|nr:transposase [Desulfuromonadaceae bacterium]MDD2854411.1 transposase [Desulfuromonadaceae bacterium]
MPRLARLDISGLLQHVVVRGIDRCDIFNDDYDRQLFVDRFFLLLSETDVRCYAWALLSNHAHFLLMPTTTPLSYFMRRLLTGYAVSFNRRNKRSGHLFQNRYKSIVCEEETYLLELVRYIHLNPLRAGMVASLEELDQFPWSGHSVLLGNRKSDVQDSGAILERFGKDATTAQLNYRHFVSEGIKTGRRDDLVGGGLKRSQGERRHEEYESFDERVLGGGNFVDGLKRECALRDKMNAVISLTRLLEIVSGTLKVDPDLIRRPSKSRAPAAARAIICQLAIFELGYRGKEVGKFLHLGPTGVSLASRRGKKILKSDAVLLKEIMSSIDK